jgi:hypothetical protein
MAAKSLPKTIPGLSFRLTIVPLINGEPLAEVEPKTFEWAGSFASDSWHEGHANLGVHVGLMDLKKRVARWYAGQKKAKKT